MINEFNNSKVVKNEGYTLYRKSDDGKPMMIFSSYLGNETIKVMEQFLEVVRNLPEATDVEVLSNGFKVNMQGRIDHYYIKRKIPKGIA